MKVLFISSNINKIKEVSAILPKKFNLLTLKDLKIELDIPEPYDTIRENAIHKAQFFYKIYQIPCLSEDSGLEVESLEGAPGALSARYAGIEKNDQNNNKKLLDTLESMKFLEPEKRKAQYRSIFCLYQENGYETFEGVLKGEIALSPKGNQGFGYDPIFIPEGYQESLGVLGIEVKNKISHRKIAFDKLIIYLNQ
ncbi:MAG: RdgB/HAM1 family non-canonical purine NTP pyrophosphatase [Chitinophagales bacterium]|jgi:XTP/dITP diphosphohydrolase|nr:RdgB/HAM1 family non-canonical purine NTP pyrophosphatase [Chitinophagales bacterium]